MSEDVFVLVCAGRSYKAKARLLFRDLGSKHSLNDNLINLIYVHYMDLVHEHSMVLVPIHAALQRAWVQQTLRVPITRRREGDLLEDKRRADDDTMNAAHASWKAARASRNADEALRNVEYSKNTVTRAHILQDQQNPRQSARNARFSMRNARRLLLEDEERLAVAEQRAASDAATAKSLAETEAKGDARDAVRATEIARIGPMMKIPDWVDAVVFFT